MKVSAIFLASILLLVFTAVDADADVDAKLLVGTWKGTLSIKMGKTNDTQTAVMEFRKDGTLIAKVGANEDRAKYTIKGDKISFDSPNKPKMFLVNIKLTKTRLSGEFVPEDPKQMPPGVKLRLTLTRSK